MAFGTYLEILVDYSYNKLPSESMSIYTYIYIGRESVYTDIYLYIPEARGASVF